MTRNVYAVVGISASLVCVAVATYYGAKHAWPLARPKAKSGKYHEICLVYATEWGSTVKLVNKSIALVEHLTHHAVPVTTSKISEIAIPDQYTLYLFFVATTGNGDAPKMAGPFFSKLSTKRKIRKAWENIGCRVVCIGDSSYLHFCKFGLDLHKTLASAGSDIGDAILYDVKSPPELEHVLQTMLNDASFNSEKCLERRALIRARMVTYFESIKLCSTRPRPSRPASTCEEKLFKAMYIGRCLVDSIERLETYGTYLFKVNLISAESLHLSVCGNIDLYVPVVIDARLLARFDGLDCYIDCPEETTTIPR